ncbi:MAG TPA: VOC family protein [Terracidiphilus sp.]|jgi:hypothetical protein|nr:VOC family protein [Terracidiphilus sp.]
MGKPAQHHAINYIEFSANDVGRAKQFYGKVFGWKFQDWGSDYASFDAASAGIDGGFRKREAEQSASADSPLIVLYSNELKATEAAITKGGGSIVVPAFEFPGGWRFHFADGCGNVLAVWSDRE